MWFTVDTIQICSWKQAIAKTNEYYIENHHMYLNPRQLKFRRILGRVDHDSAVVFNLY